MKIIIHKNIMQPPLLYPPDFDEVGEWTHSAGSEDVARQGDVFVRRREESMCEEKLSHGISHETPRSRIIHLPMDSQLDRISVVPSSFELEHSTHCIQDKNMYVYYFF